MDRSVCSSFRFRRVLTAVAVLLCAAPAFADTHYVDRNSANPVYPYANWTNAATNIQDAIDASSLNDVVLVTNGVYESGARVTPGYSLSNRVVITNNILVKSVNGPAVTIIKGQGPAGVSAVRCVFVTNGVLDGFTLTNGFTGTDGDGDEYDLCGGGACAQGGTLTNCTLSGNTAYYGGGAAYGTLNNCTISGVARQIVPWDECQDRSWSRVG